MTARMLPDARAEALFASWCDRSEPMPPAVVRATVAATVRLLGVQGCASCVAQEYGEHPETAAARMAWAVAVVAVIWPARGVR